MFEPEWTTILVEAVKPKWGLTFPDQQFDHFLHLILLSLEFLNEVHPQILVILPPFGVEFGMENVNRIERGNKPCFESRVACEGRFESPSQDSNLRM